MTAAIDADVGLGVDAPLDGPEPDGAEHQPTGRPRRGIPRSVFAVPLVVVLAWWLLVADTAADNDITDGIETLRAGLVELPGIVFDRRGYVSWWEFVTESEGWANVWGNIVDHLQLVLTSMVIATIVSVALGILIHRMRPLRGPVLGVASILLTVPSLAMFAIFISIPSIGIGDRGPIIALALYSILPILRNTVTGLDDVDRSIIEASKGMGLSAWQRLARIEFPLAWPVILTGIRLATLLNIGIAAIAPLVGGTGLGRYINDGFQRFPDVTSVERIWTGVVFSILLALVLDGVFTLLRRLTTSRGLQA